ncbi:MAG: YdcF family protein [Candidatus Margulisbacteria bacterium]|nr:YdcF family protein [Candidatus Margulisiibacteriota bacterium]
MKRALAVIVIVLIAGFSLYPFMLEGAASFLIVRERITPADLIVVLAGDDNGERVTEGVKLYREGYARKLLMSGGPLAWEMTAAEVMKRQAEKMGIPGGAISLQDRSKSTLEDAEFSLPIVKGSGARSVILVTSPTHSRRALRVFKKVFSRERIRVVSCPARVTKFKLPRWWERHEDTQAVVSEYVALVFYFFKGY